MIECRICLEDSTNEQLISPCGCDGTAKWVEFNKKWSEQWPVITEKKEPLPDAEKLKDEPDKLNKYFKDK